MRRGRCSVYTCISLVCAAALPSCCRCTSPVVFVFVPWECITHSHFWGKRILWILARQGAVWLDQILPPRSFLYTRRDFAYLFISVSLCAFFFRFLFSRRKGNILHLSVSGCDKSMDKSERRRLYLAGVQMRNRIFFIWLMHNWCPMCLPSLYCCVCKECVSKSGFCWLMHFFFACFILFCCVSLALLFFFLLYIQIMTLAWLRLLLNIQRVN